MTRFPGSTRQWTASEDSSRYKCDFSTFCPKVRDESTDSLRAPRTHPIFVEFCPYRRGESFDSSRDECHFSDFALSRDESVNSSRDKPHFSVFCPKARNEPMASCAPRWLSQGSRDNFLLAFETGNPSNGGLQSQHGGHEWCEASEEFGHCVPASPSSFH